MKKIAIISDVHSLVEPLEAVLEDIQRRDITEIYSLGDNIGVGPNPVEVLELLKKYDIKSIRGNSEEYCLLGVNSFDYVINNPAKKQSQEWTMSQLKPSHLTQMKLYPVSFELLMGGKKIGLCHFSNDVRFDYKQNSTWSYQSNFNNPMKRLSASNQFFYTNSKEQLARMQKEIEYLTEILSKTPNAYYQARLEVLKKVIAEPLFEGKILNVFDAIIQGHIHWKINDDNASPIFHSIRALGMAYGTDSNNKASYVILTETEYGYTMEEVLVKFDRDHMLAAIDDSDMPDKTLIKKFVQY